MATHLPPSQQPVVNDREAVILMTHELTWFLGAEAVARKVLMLPALFEAATSLRLVPLRHLFDQLFSPWELAPSIPESPAGAAGVLT